MGLKDLIRQREQNFRDHTQQYKKKTLVALQRLFHPFTLLTLTYVGFMIYVTHRLFNADGDRDERIDYSIKRFKAVDNIITIVIVLLLLVVDIYLKI